MEIKTLTIKFANIYLLRTSSGWIMIDAGWPDTFAHLQRLLKQNGISADDIRYLLITHFHPDHAGLAQNIRGCGAGLILHTAQVPFVAALNAFFRRKPEFRFIPIDTNNCLVVTSAESRAFFAAIGIKGELIATPGHTDDSISLVIDDYCAFIGDLPVLSLAEAYQDPKISNSWKLIQSFRVKTIYPAHGPACTI